MNLDSEFVFFAISFGFSQMRGEAKWLWRATTERSIQ